MNDERENEPVTGDADLEWDAAEDHSGDEFAGDAAAPVVEAETTATESELDADSGAEDELSQDDLAAAAAVASTGAGASGTRDPAVYQLVFCCLGIFVASMWMPIEGAHLDLYAKDSISGGFLTWFAAYGFVAGLLTMAYGKLVVWPAFFAAVDGLYVVTTRLIGMKDRFGEAETFREQVGVAGSGLYVIAIASLLILWMLVTEVRGAAKRAKEKEEALKAARGSSRRSIA